MALEPHLESVLDSWQTGIIEPTISIETMRMMASSNSLQVDAQDYHGLFNAANAMANISAQASLNNVAITAADKAYVEALI